MSGFPPGLSAGCINMCSSGTRSHPWKLGCSLLFERALWFRKPQAALGASVRGGNQLGKEAMTWVEREPSYVSVTHTETLG